MKESDIINLLKKELDVEGDMDLDMEGWWDSLELVTILMALDEVYEDKLKDIRELQTVKTPRNLLDILKTHGFID